MDSSSQNLKDVVEKFVAGHGELADEEFGASVSDYLSRNLNVDPDSFMELAIKIYTDCKSRTVVTGRQ